MDTLLRSKSLPPGIRFHPTDEEIFMYYLKRKVLGKSLGHQMMSELDVFQFAPWELPAKACLITKDLNWFFICPRSKKYLHGSRANRATVHGYWKSTGTDRTFNFKNRPVGKIKTLIFHRGKAPKGERTDWVLHEYRLEDRQLLEKGASLDSYVICKVFQKSGLGPKNGESYGAPFVEEEWDSDNDDNLKPDRGLVLHPEGCDNFKQPVSMDVAQSRDDSVITSSLAGHDSASPLTQSRVQQPPYPATEGLSLPPIETEDELDKLLALFTDEADNLIPEKDIFNGLEDLPGEGGENSEAEFDWSKLLSDDYYLKLKDLLG